MSLDVTFERGGEVIRETVPIGLDWGPLERTFGFQCSQLNDYRNDYKIWTQVRLTAWGHRDGEMVYLNLDSRGTSVTFTPPEIFPSDLVHSFQHSPDLRIQIANGSLQIKIHFTERLPWRLTERSRHLEVYCDIGSWIPVGPLGLRLMLWLVFRPPVRPAPIEFEWGTPNVLSGAFESNRRKH